MAARKLLEPILIGGLIAGVLDITYAFVFSYLRSGRSPAFILKSVASGAFLERLTRWRLGRRLRVRIVLGMPWQQLSSRRVERPVCESRAMYHVDAGPR